MTKEEHNNKNKCTIKWTLVNLGAMVVTTLLLVFGTMKWIASYTRHGEYITVPSVVGMFEAEAARALEEVGLHYEVSDYKFDNSFVEGGVIEQKPVAGAYVKENRKIYITINSGKEPVRAVPDLADNSSLRAAASQLEAAGFKLSPTIYVDGDLDWVYEIRYKGIAIEAGTEVPEGSVLTIVAGNGNAIPEPVDSGEVIVDTEFFVE